MNEVKAAKPLLLPPRPGVCQTCAVQHEPELPHNAQSLYYQVKFNLEHDRYPTWSDAMEHCSDEMKATWREALKNAGVDVDSGQLSPERPSV